MASHSRQLLEVTPEFYDWVKDFLERSIANADRLKAIGRPVESNQEYLLYHKILRAMSQHNDKNLRLAYKEAKLLWREVNKVVDHLTEKVLPEYDRRIEKEPASREKYQPYIEKTRRVKALLVIGIAELRSLL